MKYRQTEPRTSPSELMIGCAQQPFSPSFAPSLAIFCHLRRLEKSWAATRVPRQIAAAKGNSWWSMGTSSRAARRSSGRFGAASCLRFAVSGSIRWTEQ